MNRATVVGVYAVLKYAAKHLQFGLIEKTITDFTMGFTNYQCVSHNLLSHMTRLCTISVFICGSLSGAPRPFIIFNALSNPPPPHPHPMFSSPFLHCAIRRLLPKGFHEASWNSLGDIHFLQRYFMTDLTSTSSILSVLHTRLFTAISLCNQKLPKNPILPTKNLQ